MTPEAYVSRALSIDGTPAGNSNMIGNYAVPTTFFYTVPQDSVFHMARLLIAIRDQGSMGWDGYGAVASALANGVIIRVVDEDSVPIVTTPPFKTNASWAAVSFDARFISDSANDKILIMPWSFSDAGNPMVLHEGYRVEAIVSDDLSFLLDHRISVNGELR